MTHSPQSNISQYEFTFLMALLMSVVAISIDALVPALGLIGTDFQLQNPNSAQYAIGFIFCGMAIGQLVCGPLSDAMGRKPIIYIGMLIYLIGSVICLLSHDFSYFLFGRLLQGLGVASPYVSTISIVRDKYSGNDMARVMSFIMMIFIIVPAIAPSLGQGVMMLGSWHNIFWLYIVYAVLVIGWMSLRLEETLPKEHRIPFHAKNIADGFREVLGNRITMGYMLAIGAIFGGMIGYLNSAQQIFQVQFGTGTAFTLYFGGLALIFGLSSMLNGKLVNKFGMRPLCTKAMKLLIIASALFLGVHMLAPVIQLWMALVYFGVMYFCLGLMFGNLNAIAMEPMEHVAGIASAVIGFTSSVISLTLGSFIGQMYNNTLVPIVAGLIILNVIALIFMRWADKGKATTQ